MHITTNNTIEGTEWKTLPDVGDAPLVADASSDIFSRPIDVGRFGLIYAGAQKNLGPSGVTLVIIREDLLARSPDSAADDAELQGAGGEQLALQHAEHVRHLHPRPDDEVAEVAGRPGRRSRAINAAQGGEAVRARSIAPASIAAPRRRTAGR